jgi:hypothetical protein
MGSPKTVMARRLHTPEWHRNCVETQTRFSNGLNEWNAASTRGRIRCNWRITELCKNIYGHISPQTHQNIKPRDYCTLYCILRHSCAQQDLNGDKEIHYDPHECSERQTSSLAHFYSTVQQLPQHVNQPKPLVLVTVITCYHNPMNSITTNMDEKRWKCIIRERLWTWGECGEVDRLNFWTWPPYSVLISYRNKLYNIRLTQLIWCSV